eukprot:TRINITY_DN10101_c0_g1_i2.p1 TRINITY_DN10101_c0_g1~~TRINITY_DN10101_c0_g1_i2.p1  ORF type:complete len:100 (+),score=29.46 TRINITY_DN10101_c0_g1_i2:129-428(+)
MDAIPEDVSGEEGSEQQSEEEWCPTQGVQDVGEVFCTVGGEEEADGDSDVELEQGALEDLRKAYAERREGAADEESDTESGLDTSDSDSDSQQIGRAHV